MNVRALLVPLSFLLLTGSAAAQHWFSAPRIVTEGGTLLAAGDLDHDGDADLVTRIATQIVPLLNDGFGVFVPGAGQLVAAGSSTNSEPARLGDVDGDTFLDLVMVGGSAMHIYRGLPGGSFAPLTSVPVPFNVSAYDLGDMNQDGRADIAIISTSAMQAGWVFHNGTTFQTTSFISTGDFVTEVAAIDTNGDGNDDLVASLSSFNQILFVPTLAGQPTLGGTMIAGPTGGQNGAFAVGDLDNDGDDDLVVLYNDSSDLDVVTLENTGTQLQLGNATNFNNAGFEVSADGVLLGDWDGDGDADLASQTLVTIAGQGRIRSFLIENSGGLTFSQLYETPTSSLGWVAGIVDFDGDGHRDLASAGTITPGDGTLLGFPMAPNFSVSTSAAIVDIDGDGDLDLRYGNVVSKNNAAGLLTTPPNFLPAPAAGLEYRAGVHADFDGDGIADVIVQKWQPSGSIFVPDVFIEMDLLKGTGTGAYVEIGPVISPGNELLSPVAGDYDLDGDIDLITQAGVFPPAIWRNVGNGTFPATLPAPAGIVEDQADIDLDGDIDILARSGNVLMVHLTLGGGAFQSAAVLSVATLDTGARLLDLDDDGDVDIVAQTVVSSPFGSTHTLHLLENSGNGLFLPAISFDLVGFDPEAYGVDDVDGDGLTDLLVASTNDDAATWSENTDYGRVQVRRRIGPGLVYAAPTTFIGNRTAAFADMDGDGDVDILGRTFVRSRKFHGESAGLIRQFGAGTPGSGGAVPLIGAKGPARVGSNYELRFVNGLAGRGALLVLGTEVIDVANAPVGGAHFYVGNLLLTLPLVLPGPAGVAGQGSFTISTPIAPALLGLRIVHQTLHGDPAAQWGISTSNGLEVVFGG